MSTAIRQEWDYLRDCPRKPHIWKSGGLWRCGWTRGRRQSRAHSPAAAYEYFMRVMA